MRSFTCGADRLQQMVAHICKRSASPKTLHPSLWRHVSVCERHWAAEWKSLWWLLLLWGISTSSTSSLPCHKGSHAHSAFCNTRIYLSDFTTAKRSDTRANFSDTMTSKELWKWLIVAASDSDWMWKDEMSVRPNSRLSALIWEDLGHRFLNAP